MPPPRTEQLWGQGLDALFPEGSAPTAIVPWPSAGRRKGEPHYEQAAVVRRHQTLQRAVRAPTSMSFPGWGTARVTARTFFAGVIVSGDVEERWVDTADPQVQDVLDAARNRNPADDDAWAFYRAWSNGYLASREIEEDR